MTATVFQSDLRGLRKLRQGKVRDIYEVDQSRLLIVATDRLSAFDVVLPDPIPGKGRVLTEIANFWFEKTGDIVPNHLTGTPASDVLDDHRDREQTIGRSVVVRRLAPLPLEAVVRGYLIGSGWKDYVATGSVCGVKLPLRLEMSEQLPQPVYTPATKAANGHHDENISYEQTVSLVGAKVADDVRRTALELYSLAAEYALGRGIIIADTKFEFALDENGTLVLIDEALTPDSSRFWPAATYRPGVSPPSFDKQYVRDYLETLDWDKKPPGPRLPEEVIRRTSDKYHEAMRQLTGRDLPPL